MNNEEIKLMDVYRALVETPGFFATEDGFVRVDVGDGEVYPVLGKDGKQVVLPLQERLKDQNNKSYEFFHLLSENSKTNASDLQSRYRHWLVNRYSIVFGGLATALLTIAADKELTKKLRPDQAQFLGMVVEADTRTVQDFSKIADVAAKPNQVQQVFMHLYLRNVGVVNGQSYSRVAVVNFPFYDELVALEHDEDQHKSAKKAKSPPKDKKAEHEVFGVAIRKKDRPALMGLVRYLIPNVGTAQAYDVGSNSRIAPSVDAMMHAFLPMARHLNDIIDLFKGVDGNIDRDLEQMTFKLDWVDAFENLDGLWNQIRLVPPQNQGVAEEPAPAAPTAAASPTQQPRTTTTPVPVPVPPHAQQTMQPPPWNPSPYPQQPQPQTGYYPPVNTGHPATPGTVNVAEMMHNSMRGGMRGPVPGQQPMGYGYGAPAQTYGAPAAPGYGGGYPAPGYNPNPQRRY